jgi:hypothetical protein
MSEQQPKDISQISRDLGEEAQALNDIHDQGLRPEDQETWNALVAEHKAKHAENSDAIEGMLREKVKAGNEDLQARREANDHNDR